MNEEIRDTRRLQACPGLGDAADEGGDEKTGVEGVDLIRRLRRWAER